MFMAAYRNTERSAKAILHEKLAAEQRVRILAQRAAWTAAALRAHAESDNTEIAPQANDKREASGLPYTHTYVEIERRARKLFNLTHRDLISDRRHNEVVLARQFIMYWTCRLTRHSLPTIGKLMHRDHTSVLHGRDVYPAKRGQKGRTLRRAR